LDVSPNVEGSESVSGKGEVGAGRGEGEMREGAIMGSRGAGYVVKDRKK
jgi:hypothetical protein